MLSAPLAEKCFEENVRLFANTQTEPEKYNHYNGLRALAVAVKELQAEVHQLRQELAQRR